MEEGSWEGLLDIIGLSDEEKKTANLEELKQFQNREPSNSLLFELSNDIYGDLDSGIYLLWFDRTISVTKDNQILKPEKSRIIHKTISRNEIEFFKELWFSLLGHYLLVLPKGFEMNISETADEEEFIGVLLRKYKSLYLKTPDANVILHLALS